MNETSHDHPGVIAFPPFIGAGAVVLAGLLQWIFPLSWPFPWCSRWVGVGVALAGVACAAAARREMSRVGTNVDPGKPTLAIATQGPYRVSRNPMYLSLALFQLGVAIGARWMWGIAMLVPYFAVIHWGVVLREEAYLTGKFGDTYRDYRARVRRYL